MNWISKAAEYLSDCQPDDNRVLTKALIRKAILSHAPTLIIPKDMVPKESKDYRTQVAADKESHALVIDAEKLAEKFWDWIDDEGGSAEFYRMSTLDSLETQEYNRLRAKFMPQITQLISDSIKEAENERD